MRKDRLNGQVGVDSGGQMNEWTDIKERGENWYLAYAFIQIWIKYGWIDRRKKWMVDRLIEVCGCTAN